MKEEKKEKKTQIQKKPLQKNAEKEGAYFFSPTFVFRMKHSSSLPLSMFLQC